MSTGLRMWRPSSTLWRRGARSVLRIPCRKACLRPGMPRLR